MGRSPRLSSLGLLASVACGAAERSTTGGDSGASGATSLESSAESGGEASGATGAGESGGTSESSGASASESGSGSETSTATTTSESAGETGPRLDVGPGAGDEGGSGCDPNVDEECGCTAVDVLFMIDNSSSMLSYQASLGAAAPGFADALIQSLPPGTDLHVGVTTSSFYGGPGTSGGTSPGQQDCSVYYAGAGLTGRDDFYTWYFTPDAHPYPENGGQGRLLEHAGKTFFEYRLGDDPTAMKDWLVGNISTVGGNGSAWEMSAAGCAYPFHPANDMANGGFLRDEGAVLVIFALTDALDFSPDEVSVYHDMIVAAKTLCGGDRCIVTGGIMQTCLATDPETRLYPLLASFGQDPVIADIGPQLDRCFDDCESGSATRCNQVDVSCDELRAGLGTPQYIEALNETLVQVIAKTCAEIPPPVG